jgi:hypothetical protein
MNIEALLAPPTESTMNLKATEPILSKRVLPRIRAGSRFAGSFPGWLASLGVAALLFFVQSNVALAQVAPPLGTLAPYGIASSTLTNTALGTTTNGRVCYTIPPAVAVGSAGIDTPCAPQVGVDQGTALGILNGQACVALPAGNLDAIVIGANPPGTIPPGCYFRAGAINIVAGGNVTLNGSGVYIFKSTGAGVTTGANSHVNLAGGACADNVFWAPVGAVSLGATSTFVGNMLDAAGITIGAGTAVTGRALAFGGTVTTDTDTITLPAACPPPGGSVGAIPTLSQWTMILLTGLLAIVGFVAMRRKQRQSTRPL